MEEALYTEAEAQSFCAGAEEEGLRLDLFCASKSGASRAMIQKLIEAGAITANGRPEKARYRCRAGDEIRIAFPPPAPLEAVAEDIPIDVVYEDADIAVIDKAQGMVVHPAPGHESGTLVNALLFRLQGLSGVGGALRPGIVHRIDRMTSGLLVVAKNDAAHQSLSAQMKNHSAGRIYLALAEGGFAEDSGCVDAPIGRSPKDRKKMAVVEGGRTARTHWHVLLRLKGCTLLRLELETGRTHQIRVHMRHIGHPLLGDEVYGSPGRLGLEGQALHACKLHLRHPRTGEAMEFFAPAPPWFMRALRRAGADAASLAYLEPWLGKIAQ